MKRKEMNCGGDGVRTEKKKERQEKKRIDQSCKETTKVKKGGSQRQASFVPQGCHSFAA